MPRKLVLIGLGCIVLAAIVGTWVLHRVRVQPPGAVTTAGLTTAAPQTNSDDSRISRPKSAQPKGAVDPREARRKATDYQQLVNLLLPLARNGSASAQYEIASALHYCDENWRAHVVSGTGGAIKTAEELRELYARLPANTQSLLADADHRCRSFSGDLAILDTSGDWLDQSVKADYPPAVLMKAALTMKTLLLTNGDSAAIQQARKDAIIASTSADPEVLFGMAGFVDVAGKTRDQLGQLVSAWLLLACESGYDCGSESDAVKGICTVDPQCANNSTLVEDIQRTSGANFGEVQQFADQIRAAINARDPDEIRKYL